MEVVTVMDREDQEATDMVRLARSVAAGWRIAGHDRDDLESIAVEAALLALKRHREGSGSGSMQGYVAQTVRNRLASAGCKAARRIALAKAHREDPSLAVVHPWRYELVTALVSLTDRQRRLCEMLAVGYTHRDAAKAMRISTRTVWLEMAEIRRAMALHGFGDGEGL